MQLVVSIRALLWFMHSIFGCFTGAFCCILMRLTLTELATAWHLTTANTKSVKQRVAVTLWFHLVGFPVRPGLIQQICFRFSGCCDEMQLL